MTRENKRIHAENKLLNPLIRFVAAHNYPIKNGFINLMIKRKNRFYISIDKGYLLSLPFTTDRDLEEMINLLSQFDKLYYKTLFEGEVFKLSLIIKRKEKFNKCKIISISSYKKVA